MGGQLDAFVRFRVLSGQSGEIDEIWKDPALWDSWIQYQNSLNQNADVCYVTGKRMQISELSPKKIRNPGDGAKLISSNDASGFTFRGRFELPSEAACVGRVTTEKAHNALRWLIGKQAYINRDQVILSWLSLIHISANGLRIGQRITARNHLRGDTVPDFLIGKR